jgi:hypothetical protein
MDIRIEVKILKIFLKIKLIEFVIKYYSAYIFLDIFLKYLFVYKYKDIKIFLKQKLLLVFPISFIFCIKT